MMRITNNYLLIENYVSQIGRLFCAKDISAMTDVAYTTVLRHLHEFEKVGMIRPVKGSDSNQYYLFNRKFNMSTYVDKERRVKALADMKENGELYHQMLSEVG